jgi:hypothetical protein
MSVGTLRKIIIEKCGFITYEEVRENAFQGKKNSKNLKNYSILLEGIIPHYQKKEKTLNALNHKD